MAQEAATLPAMDGDAVDPIEESILGAFSERAMRGGIRSVNMGRLAQDLRISPTTLYKHFPSKADLVLASVERWAQTIGAIRQLDEPRGKTAQEGFAHWVDHFARAGSGISREFIRDLRKYPQAWERFQIANREGKARGAAMLRPLLRADVDTRVALAICGLLMDQVSRPDFAERLDVSRGEAIRCAMDIWAQGALRVRRD